ncbi:hypothetical protein GGH92_010743, partial [Coemansia sp. RSA 2673]
AAAGAFHNAKSNRSRFSQAFAFSFARLPINWSSKPPSGSTVRAASSARADELGALLSDIGSHGSSMPLVRAVSALPSVSLRSMVHSG